MSRQHNTFSTVATATFLTVFLALLAPYIALALVPQPLPFVTVSVQVWPTVVPAAQTALVAALILGAFAAVLAGSARAVAGTVDSFFRAVWRGAGTTVWLFAAAAATLAVIRIALGQPVTG